jgi:uncharacterized SAM-binding protein YcdF (DUF218 family)
MIMVYLIMPVLLMVALFLLYAPGFLYTEDIPGQAVDSVVLFVGPGNEARLEEAKQLLKEGCARYLIIPSTGEMLTAETVSRQVWKAADNQSRGNFLNRNRVVAGHKKYFENTHIEALEAKRMMDERGLHSALLVSSAYHTRRIRLIADRVFTTRNYEVFCTPARWQAQYTVVDWLNKERRRIIVSEYLKMVWFLVYGVFASA